MLKLILNVLAPRPVAGGGVPDQRERLQWLRDPLSHPVLESMSERELGDLPFRR